MHSVTLLRQFGAFGHCSYLSVRARLLTRLQFGAPEKKKKIRLQPCLQLTCRSFPASYFSPSPGQSALV